MKKFALKLIVFIVPIIIIMLPVVILFIIMDPFMIIGNNSGYPNRNYNSDITANRDFQSTELFKKNYSKHNYNSFILGSSRSMFYQCRTWDKYIKGNCFHLNASSESLFGIKGKLSFLDRKNVEINNVLIILDYELLSKTINSDGHLTIKHPEISNESYLMFYLEMFKGFLLKSPAFIDLFVTGERKSYMGKYGITKIQMKIDTLTNQITLFEKDQLIKKNPELYYADIKNIFYKRDTIQSFSNPIIQSKQKKLLFSIYTILKSHKTNYKIIISPLYDQKKINQSDLSYLQSVFGIDNIYDFSGINMFTDDYRNFYEPTHYRPNVADSIIKIVYKNVQAHNN